MSERPCILIVDDEIRSLEALKRNLATEFEILLATSVAEARRLLEREPVRIIMCDQRMPDMTGVEFLREVRDTWPDVIRIIISGYTDPGDIITAINEAGIYHYVTKPWHPEKLILTLKNALHLYDLERQNELLAVELRHSGMAVERKLRERRNRLRRRYSFDDGIVCAPDSPMKDVCRTLRKIAPYDVPVLITGESGTGKELVARALHYNSGRADRPFVVENCGALPDELLESELFGHRRGAFTGAIQDHTGLFERAGGGTIFLDEIGDITPAFQVKLLRVLQEGEIRPLGSTRTRKVDVRVIAATNRPLELEARHGKYRRDLYFRLAGVEIHLPPLRERPQDIALLAGYFLEKCAAEIGRNVEGFTDEALECMRGYHWPGNVRELHHEVQRMLILGEEPRLGADLLSPRVRMALSPEEEEEEPLARLSRAGGTLKERIELLEARILREALIRNRWNKSLTARELGLSRVGLRGKMERYGLIRAEGREEAGKTEQRRKKG